MKNSFIRSFCWSHTVFIYFISRSTFIATSAFVIRLPPQTSPHLHHTCPPAAHPSCHVIRNPQQRMSPLTQPICLLSPDNQSRGNRSPGHVSLRSLSCNRICSQAPPPPPFNPPTFFSYTCTPLILICPSFRISWSTCAAFISHIISSASFTLLFTCHDNDGGQTCLWSVSVQTAS